LLTSGKINNQSSDTTGGRTPQFQDSVSLFTGANGAGRRNWRFTISDLTASSNALILEFQKDGNWIPSQVFLSK
jgi:hypothetical protein